MLQKYGYTEGCEGCRAKAGGMTQKLHREACRKRIEQAHDWDAAGRELCRKNTERENQRIAEKMEMDFGKRADEPMAQEPDEAKAPAACSQGGQEETMQEEKMQEEETAVMKTKRPMEDEETEAKRPRVDDEPKDFHKLRHRRGRGVEQAEDAELKLHDHGEGLRPPTSNRSTTVHARTRRTTATCSNRRSEPIDAERSDELHDQSVQRDQAGVSGVVRMIQRVRDQRPRGIDDSCD